jgi:hypothetical protein
MKHRKTISLELIRSRANAFLANSANDQTEQRTAYHNFAATLLTDAGSYCGFRYLSKADVTPGQSFGIQHNTPPEPPTWFDVTRTQLL